MGTDTEEREQSQQFEVIADSVTIHKQVGELRDPISNQVIGIQQGLGKTYLRGEVVKRADISPILLEALEDEDHPSHEYVAKRIRATSDDERENTGARLGAPFAGYDEMKEDDIVRAMGNLPSATIAAIKRYEGQNEGRASIVDYNVGYGESPVARQTGKVSSKRQKPAEGKAVGEIRSRENPPPDDKVVEPGEGITGTGEPKIPHGTAAKEEKEEGSGRKKTVSRRSRRSREESGSGDGDGDNKGDGSSES